MAEKSAQHRNITQNKKAWHDYFVDEKIEAGVELFGTEVKSLRQGAVNLKDSYCSFKNGEIFALYILLDVAQVLDTFMAVTVPCCPDIDKEIFVGVCSKVDIPVVVSLVIEGREHSMQYIAGLFFETFAGYGKITVVLQRAA